MVKGVFIKRINRRLAAVDVDGEYYEAYVSNGAEMSFLKEGSTCYLREAANFNRSTLFDLYSVYDQDTLVCVDAKAPLYVATEWYVERLKKEWPDEDISYLESPRNAVIYMFRGNTECIRIQLMGTSLKKDGKAYLPEMRSKALNSRLEDVIYDKSREYDVRLLFVTCRNDVDSFFVNRDADDEFANLLSCLRKMDTKIECLRCSTDEEGIKADKLIPVIFT